jgi:hypothetical protein
LRAFLSEAISLNQQIASAKAPGNDFVLHITSRTISIGRHYLGEAMTDNLHIPQRLEGEHARRSTSFEYSASEVGIKNLEQVSLETVIRVLLQRGLCTEAELLAEENRRRSLREPVTQFNFTPVQIHRHRRHDGNRWRRWASQ